MPVTKPKAPPAATRYPPPLPTEPTVASKKKKKKKGKGKAQESSNLTLHSNHIDHDGLDDDDDDEDGPRAPENDVGRRNLDPEYDTPRYPTSQTSPLSSVQQDSLRMPTTATAHGKLLAAANELYKRMESEQRANDANEAEYWSSLPSHIRSFVETTYHQGVALNPQEMAKSQAMLDLAHAMVDEAQSRGSFPPPFDPSLLSDPKIAEKIVMKHGGLNAMMRDLADDTYDDYVSENDEEDMEDEQQYEPDESAKKKKKKKKKGANAAAINGSNTQTVPPPIIPSVPSPMPSVTRAAPSVAQPRPSSRAAGKQPVYNQPTIPPARTTRSTATKSPAPSNSYSHGYTKSAATNGTASLTKRPTGGGSDKDKSKLWNNSTEQERERIKEFWLGLSETERKDLVKLEKEAVLKKMKEQQKHSCSCAVCGRKRNAIEEELEVLYDAYYEELEQYAIHQQQYQSSGGKITPPPGPGPFPGSVAVDKHGALIGGPPSLTKHPSRGRPMTNGIRGQPLPPESDGYDDDEDYDDEDDDYEDDDEEEEEEEDESTRKLASRRRGLPPGPLTRRANGREDFFNFSSLTAAGPGNILTVADDLLKNDGGKFLEMMEQLAERRMQREEEAVREVEMDSEEEEEEEDPEGSEEEEEDDDNDDESDGEEDDPMSEEQKMEEGRKMFSIFAARMFEQRVLNAYREKVAAERQAQLLRELADEDKMQAEKDAKRAKENQKKKDKKKQQKMAKEAEKAKKDAEKAAEEAAQRAKAEAHEEEMRKKREDDRLKRETERKQKEEEKARLAEERRQRVAEQKAIEAERKREKEERERKERVVRQEKEAQAKAEKAEREKKAKEERLAKEAKEKEERERRDKEEKERKEKERLEAQKADDRKKQEAQAAAAKTPQVPISPRSSSSTIGTNTSTKKSPATTKVNGVSPAQRPPVAPISRGPSLQQPSQPPTNNGQRPVLAQTQTPVSPSMQFSPNLSMQPLGMTPYNPMVSPTTSISPRMPFNPQSSVSAGPGPYNPIIPFAQPANQPSIANVMSNGMIGNAPYPFEMQPPLVPQAQQATSLPVQPVRPPSTLPPGLAIPSKVLATPTNGMPGIGIPPLTPNAAAPHIRRASAQANPSPFGAIGKPLGARGPSSVIEDDDRIPSVGTSVSKPSPPSPDRPLGSSALVDENDDIVPIPKRRGGAPGWPENIGTAAPGSRWNRTSITSWPTPSTPGSVGAPWSAAPGRP